LEKNRGYGIETIEMGLLELSCLSLGEFIYTNKRGLYAIIFAAVFLLIGLGVCQRFQNINGDIVMTSMFGTFVPAFLFALAQTEIDSSVTSILNSLTPLNTLVLGTLVLELVFREASGLGVL
jgi:drug/metabolite transporter (DMT)-like permease